jgi:hypothetical protein
MHPRGGTLVRATTDGSFRQYRLDRVCPRHHWCLVHSLAAGSGGGAAVTMTPDEFSHGQLVRVSPTGELTSRTLPAFGFCAIPGALASGPHGTVWTSAFGNGCAVVGRANAGGGASWLWRSRGRVWDLAVAGRWLWAATDLGLARFDTRHSSKPKPSAPSGGGGR